MLRLYLDTTFSLAFNVFYSYLTAKLLQFVLFIKQINEIFAFYIKQINEKIAFYIKQILIIFCNNVTKYLLFTVNYLFNLLFLHITSFLKGYILQKTKIYK